MSRTFCSVRLGRTLTIALILVGGLFITQLPELNLQQSLPESSNFHEVNFVDETHSELPKLFPKSGTLILAGGGKPSLEMLQILREIGETKIVYIPTADELFSDESAANTREVWRDRGFTEIVFLHADTREAAEAPEFTTPLDEHLAVFIAGGKQRLLQERYVGTNVPSALQRLLARGGVVAGTSAGMAALPETMVVEERMNPDGSREVLEAPGFGIISLLAEQHFLERNRGWRMEEMQRRYPERYGIAVDKNAAVVIHCNAEDSTCYVVGDSEAFLFAPKRTKAPMQTIPPKSKNSPLQLSKL